MRCSHLNVRAATEVLNAKITVSLNFLLV
eukprot:SAG31_NODE_24146_length_488_cov_0.799486_1_plen_28_part_10